MKKIILKKIEDSSSPNRIGYRIDYEAELNQSQFEAVMHNNGASLVVAGAGTGKTRTLIYRLARLVEDRVPPESILLLTFTRKSASEMLRRASIMLDGRCERVSGGTFHSFALFILRQYANLLNYDLSFNVIDQSDCEDTVNLLRSQLKYDKTKKRFPHKETLVKIFNLSINRQETIEDVVVDDYPYFIDEIDKITQIFRQYNEYKQKYNLMDYDDLLLNLNILTKNYPQVQKELHQKYKYIMVDEYQDTNRLQHDIVINLAGPNENVMAVGDEAQSIYSFRGAEFQNIMNFPKSFKDCKIFKIEENYRSTQQILDLTNKIIESAIYSYRKELFTRKKEGDLPKIITAENERQQSLFVVQQILELREEGFPLDDIAVLFRSGFLSFDLEIELNRANIPYKKFGGLKFIETAHIKDLLAYFKILFNPKDIISWHRVLLLLDGVGPRTATKIVDLISEDKINFKGNLNLSYLPKGKEEIEKLLTFLTDLNNSKLPLGEKASIVSEYYKLLMKNKYDDWQRRWKDIETFIAIAERYKNVNEFLNDMTIEPPTESVVELEPESNEEEFLNLSTIHSAKGLEWRAVFLIWALEGRFPSSKSVETVESLEEERRLFYVACTRAKDRLYITYPTNIYDRESGIVLSKPSRFLENIDEATAERYVLQEWSPDEN
jgi:DNA helicase-2/ATP-dependent DNA helicase PcrA